MEKYKNPKDEYSNYVYNDIVNNINHIPTHDSLEFLSIESLYCNDYVEMYKYLQTLKLKKSTTFGRILRRFK